MIHLILFEDYTLENEFYKEIDSDDIHSDWIDPKNSINIPTTIEGRETNTEKFIDGEIDKILSFNSSLFRSSHQTSDEYSVSLTLDTMKYITSLKAKEKSLNWSDPRLKGGLNIQIIVTKLADEYYLLHLYRSNDDKNAQTDFIYLCDQMEGLEKCIKNILNP